MRVPEDAKGPIELHAKLNYRKFSHFYTSFSYAGQPKADGAAFSTRPPVSGSSKAWSTCLLLSSSSCIKSVALKKSPKNMAMPTISYTWGVG